VWLPIDAKYPRNTTSACSTHRTRRQGGHRFQAGKAFETSMRLEAKKIFAKYVAPPHTTDFAILYLPTEGLYAEALRRPGLMEALQNDCK
jgi:DNA recombination protein RmuC